jgi:hypothetical protein
MPGHRSLGEPRNFCIVNCGNRSPDQVAGLPPTGPQHQSHVMVRGPGSMGDDFGGCRGHYRRVYGRIAQIQGVGARGGHAGSLAAQELTTSCLPAPKAPDYTNTGTEAQFNQ